MENQEETNCTPDNFQAVLDRLPDAPVDELTSKVTGKGFEDSVSVFAEMMETGKLERTSYLTWKYECEGTQFTMSASRVDDIYYWTAEVIELPPDPDWHPCKAIGKNKQNPIQAMSSMTDNFRWFETIDR